MNNVDIAITYIVCVPLFYFHRITYTIDGQEKSLDKSFLMDVSCALVEVVKEMLVEKRIEYKFILTTQISDYNNKRCRASIFCPISTWYMSKAEVCSLL